jgi:hypothetical protein
MKPWMEGITSDLKENTKKDLHITTSSQLELELQSQDQYLDEQNTEM